MGTADEAEMNVELIIDGFTCDPNKITSILGTEPSETTRLGEPIVTKLSSQKVKDQIAKTKRTWQQSSWSLKSNCDLLDLDSHIKDIFSRIRSFDKINLLNEKNLQISVQCVVYNFGKRPDLNISVSTIKEMASASCALEVIVY